MFLNSGLIKFVCSAYPHNGIILPEVQQHPVGQKVPFLHPLILSQHSVSKGYKSVQARQMFGNETAALTERDSLCPAQGPNVS